MYKCIHSKVSRDSIAYVYEILIITDQQIP